MPAISQSCERFASGRSARSEQGRANRGLALVLAAFFLSLCSRRLRFVSPARNRLPQEQARGKRSLAYEGDNSMTGKHATTDQTAQRNEAAADEGRDGQRASDAEQRELWRRYLEQQARRSCPGCGDDGLPSI
jgi:hypothetical protein